MIVLFISQCEKKALKRTRRVLDSFADRIGDNTWKTIITKEGLNAVHKLLRKTATKSTAISCHWIRSRSRSELVWIVGNRDKFNEEGIVPVNRTDKNILSDYSEHDWKYLPLIKALVAVSALLHDWGKSNDFFQKKLRNKKNLSDPLRHEWVSAVLLHAHIKASKQTPTGWLEAFIKDEIDYDTILASLDGSIEKPLSDIPPLAQVVLWLILSHHKLPVYSNKKDILHKEWMNEPAKEMEEVFYFITKSWGYENKKQELDEKEVWSFSNGLLLDALEWKKELKKWAKRLYLEQELFNEAIKSGAIRVILHHARLSLMLADHHYSSLPHNGSFQSKKRVYANTDPKTGNLKQPLDEHLIGVMKKALAITHLLPTLQEKMPKVSNVRSLLKPSPKPFDWQDKALKKIKEHYKRDYGFFAVNLASTGKGKTLANAKVMQALSHDQRSLRYTLALGLRTLTLQTGDEYRQKIGLGNNQLAVLIGSQAVAMLHNLNTKEKPEETMPFGGSESMESLDEIYIDFDDIVDAQLFDTVLQSEKQQQLLYAPVLACTIDHLMGAVETKKGGRYILPALRLHNSDLVIDEIDDFTGSDLIAIGRLIYLAAMLGKRVMISSATIPPDLAEGYFNIYRSGWSLFSKTQDVSSMVSCAWIDEFHTQVVSIDADAQKSARQHYKEKHNLFIKKRLKNLQNEIVKRKADICDIGAAMEECEFDDDNTKEELYFQAMRDAILRLHQQNHSVDGYSKTNISFGVVRMANIDPCIKMYQYLLNTQLDDDTEIRVMPYHAKQVLLLRHEQEKYLDKILKRKEKPMQQPVAFDDLIVRQHIDSAKVKNLIFIVVATPVEEVGRDHDFDWAVIEPSSYRSIIQMAGRVRRHRSSGVDRPNIALMQYNLKAFKSCDENGKYYTRPGFEIYEPFATHNLKELIDEETLNRRLDATPRIDRSEELDYRHSFSDMEHYVIHKDINDETQTGANTMLGFLQEAWYLTAHPQLFHPFRASQQTLQLYLYYDENDDSISFAEKDGRGEFVLLRGEVYGIEQIRQNNNSRIWLQRNYLLLLEHYAHIYGSNKEELSKIFGEINFLYQEGREYIYSDEFGLKVM